MGLAWRHCKACATRIPILLVRADKQNGLEPERNPTHKLWIVLIHCVLWLRWQHTITRLDTCAIDPMADPDENEMTAITELDEDEMNTKCTESDESEMKASTGSNENEMNAMDVNAYLAP